jgi:hypothetical protein
MNNNVIISFLVLFCLFISTFLNPSFSNHHKSSLINIVSPGYTDNIIVNKDEYKTISFKNNSNKFDINKDLKIYYVGSYSPGHVCGQPQINSFFKRIQNIDNDFNLEVDIEG